MTSDWRRKIMGLPLAGALSEAAVRSAYWRAIGRIGDQFNQRTSDMRLLQTAKRELLFELGVRVPVRKPRRDPPILTDVGGERDG
jgi:hypothetical protein